MPKLFKLLHLLVFFLWHHKGQLVNDRLCSMVYCVVRKSQRTNNAVFHTIHVIPTQIDLVNTFKWIEYKTIKFSKNNLKNCLVSAHFKLVWRSSKIIAWLYDISAKSHSFVSCIFTKVSHSLVFICVRLNIISSLTKVYFSLNSTAIFSIEITLMWSCNSSFPTVNTEVRNSFRFRLCTCLYYLCAIGV